MSADMKPVMVNLSSEKRALKAKYKHSKVRRTLESLSRLEYHKSPPRMRFEIRALNAVLLSISAMHSVSVSASQPSETTQHYKHTVKDPSSPSVSVIHRQARPWAKAPRPPSRKRQVYPQMSFDVAVPKGMRFPLLTSNGPVSKKKYLDDLQRDANVNLAPHVLRQRKKIHQYFAAYQKFVPNPCDQWCCRKDEDNISQKRKFEIYAKLLGFNKESLEFYNSTISSCTAILPDKPIGHFTRVEVNYFRQGLIPNVIKLEQQRSDRNRTSNWSNNFPQLSDSQCVQMMRYLSSKYPWTYGSQMFPYRWLHDPNFSHAMPQFRNDLIQSFLDLKFIQFRDPDGNTLEEHEFSIEDDMPSMPMHDPDGDVRNYYERAKVLLTEAERIEFWGAFYKHTFDRGNTHTFLNSPKFKKLIDLEEVDFDQ